MIVRAVEWSSASGSCRTLPSSLDHVQGRAIFRLGGDVNRHSSRYWANGNPNWMEANHVENGKRVMTSAALWGDRLIGPYFCDGNVTG
jgi:hypothetical protein